MKQKHGRKRPVSSGSFAERLSAIATLICVYAKVGKELEDRKMLEEVKGTI